MDMSMLVSIGIPVAILILEWYLGKTDKVDSNSTLSLIANILRYFKK